MENGQYSNTIGAIKLLNEMLRLGADQSRCVPLLDTGKACSAEQHNPYCVKILTL
jgi:hypothetical protein